MAHRQQLLVFFLLASINMRALGGAMVGGAIHCCTFHLNPYSILIPVPPIMPGKASDDPLNKAVSDGIDVLKQTIKNGGDPTQAILDATLPPSMTKIPLIRDAVTVVDTGAGGGTQLIVKGRDRDAVNIYQSVNEQLTKQVTRVVGADTAHYLMAWQSLKDEKEKFDQDVNAAAAVARFTGRQMNGVISKDAAALDEIRRGKPLQGVVDASLSIPRSADENFYKATQESALIKQASQSAAAAYGGPGGAAAYAAWYAYRTTGNVNIAWREGIRTAVTSELGSEVSSMPNNTIGQTLTKAAIAGTAGGIAVAMQGGNEDAIKNAFLRGGGYVLVQGATNELKAYSPQVADTLNTVQCIAARDLDCVSHTKWAVEIKKGAARYMLSANGTPKLLNVSEYTSKWTNFDPNSPEGQVNAVITSISKLPVSSIVPVDGKRYVLTTTLGTSDARGGGVPAVVLTAVGTHPIFMWKVRYTPNHIQHTEKTQHSQQSTYRCTLGAETRTITYLTARKGCEAIYRRGENPDQVIWHSDIDKDICKNKVTAFIGDLNNIGFRCSP